MTRALRMALLLAAALNAPVTARATKAKSTPLPPYAGAYQPQTVDERGLWQTLDEAERTARDSSAIIRDEALNAYLHRVLCDAVGSDRCASVRIYVLRTPAMNADMAPNGMMRLWSGLLLRVRSEAELASVMAHEFAHFEERHTLASFRSARTTSDILAWVSLAGGYTGVNTNAAQVQLAGGLYSFARDQEQAADLRAFAYLAASRYRPGAAADFWRRMMDESDATALGRGQRTHRYDRTAFFDTHPTELQRATYLKALADKDGDDGEDGAIGAPLAAFRATFLADQLKLNDFGGSEYLLGQLGGSDWTPDLLVARGDLYRMRGNPRDLVAAANFYRQAIAKGSDDPLARRGLGLALMRSGEVTDGRIALTDYLKRKPDCEDAAMLRSLIEP